MHDVLSRSDYIEPHIFETPAIVLAVLIIVSPLTSGCQQVAARKW
jgi:hypothetical protein